MLGANFLVCAAALLATASFADAGALPGGICYSPWHHDKVNADVVNKDFKQIGQYFSAVRTYHASFSGLNVIDAAVSAGVQISVTIQMGDKNGIAGEIAAACDGAKRNPSAVRSIMVGNENLQNGGFGTFSAGELVTYINQLKGCTAGTGIKIGSVQRINEWLSAPGAPELSAACDVIGVNIYPFFTPGDTKPIDKLKAQWAQMTAKYGEEKCALHETGWPRHGSPSNGNVPSKDTLQSFLNDFAVWSAEHTRSYFFMMYDTKVSYTGDDFETSFGLADTNGVLQVSIPSGNGAPPQNTPAPAPAPAPSAPAPAPPAPAPGAPAPGAPAPGAPAPGAPAPGAPAPGAPAPGAPGAGKPGAPAPGAPAPGAPAPGAPGAGAPGAPAPGAPAPGAPAPAPPAPGKPGVAPPAPGNQTPGQNSGEVGKDGEAPKKKGKKSKKDCEA